MPEDRPVPIESHPFYLELGGQGRFCILHSPGRDVPAVDSILFVHPFGEEMNKARRTVALQARAFAQAGWSVLQIDLAGCGDSEGEFRDASWQRWSDDVTEAQRWLASHSGRSPWIWSLRTGSLLAVAAAARMSPAPRLLFWHPVISGSQFLQHLLRIRVASGLVAGQEKGSRVDTRALKTLFAQGQSLEIGGYEVSPGLASGLEAAELLPLHEPTTVVWFEVSASDDGQLSPAALSRSEAWRRAGHAVDTHVVLGPTFWQSQEIEECRPLVQATLSALCPVEA